MPVVFAALAAAAGIYAARAGEVRAGWGAIVVGFLGLGGAYLATRSSVDNLEIVFTWSTLIASMLVFATPLIYGSLGGIFSERSGVVNIGLEGMMLMGAFWAIWGADKTGNWVTGVLIGMAAGGLLGLLHAFFSVHLRADQIIGGTAINLLAIGITGYAFVQLYGTENIPAGVSEIPRLQMRFLEQHPAGQPRRLPVWRLRASERDDLGRAPVRDRRPLRDVQDAPRPAAAVRRRASARCRHRRHQRLRHALLRGDALRRPRGAQAARSCRSA